MKMKKLVKKYLDEEDMTTNEYLAFLLDSIQADGDDVMLLYRAMIGVYNDGYDKGMENGLAIGNQKANDMMSMVVGALKSIGGPLET